MIKVTNIASGPRGIHTVDGSLVMIDPGKSRNLDVPQAEVDGAPEEWFKFDEAGKEEEDENATSAIAAAIDLLDPANDDHWTNAGLPSVEAVTELVGAKVSRADINAAAPEFMRPAV